MLQRICSRLAWLAAVMVASTAHAAAPPLDAFLEKPEISAAQLSPSGRWLATIEKNGGGQKVVITDRNAGTKKTIAFSSTDHVGFEWLSWKNDNRLMFKAWLFRIDHRGGKPKADIIGVRWGSFLEAVDPDGKNLVVLFQNNPSGVRRSGASVTLLDKLKDDPDHVLVAAPNGRFQLSVWKANLTTGVADLVEIGDWKTTAWRTDATGAVVMREEAVNHSTSYQSRGANGWVEFARSRAGDDGELSDFEVLGPTSRKGEFYVANRAQKAGPDDGRGLFTYDVNAHKLGAAEWPAMRYDISSILYRGETRELAGVCYAADRFTCGLKDEAYAKSFKALEAHFHGERNIAKVSATSDGRTWVVAASAPTHPAAFYLFDTAKGSVDLIGDSMPGLPEANLGKVESYAYKARDGVEIPAYLTVPPGAGAGPRPLVVMPHGGPETRDSWDYDDLAQFVATRGYLVFQPNFRGSGGYGLGFAQAGHRQWGQRMQDDVTDGVKALIASGRADPKRICVVGASYGGYAALQAGATSGGLYRCVVSMSGVSDLGDMLNWEKKEGGGGDSDRFVYWRTLIGDPQADRAMLAKASPATYAKDYGPPVLLIHGEFDGVVPVKQSKDMDAALRRAGKDVKLIVLDEEGHGGFTTEHGRIAFGAIADFLAKHIGAEAH